MSQNGEPRPVELPVFTGDDVVRLFAATYLPLCRSLRAAGALDTKVLAQAISSRAAVDAASSWGGLALALAEVLAEDARTA